MAKEHDGRRQVKSKMSKRYPRPGRSFNYLQGEARKWAKSNRFDTAEHCVSVKDGNRFSGSDETKLKCGDGRSGFSTRKTGQDEVNMEMGIDGQYKKKRHTLVRPRSAKCSSSRKARRIDGSVYNLANNDEIALAMRDPRIVVAEKKLVRIKSHRWRQLTRRQKRERVEIITKLKAIVRGTL